VREKYAAALLILALTASISAALFSSPAAAADSHRGDPAGREYFDGFEDGDLVCL